MSNGLANWVNTSGRVKGILDPKKALEIFKKQYSNYTNYINVLITQ